MKWYYRSTGCALRSIGLGLFSLPDVAASAIAWLECKSKGRYTNLEYARGEIKEVM